MKLWVQNPKRHVQLTNKQINLGESSILITLNANFLFIYLNNIKHIILFFHFMVTTLRVVYQTFYFLSIIFPITEHI